MSAPRPGRGGGRAEAGFTLLELLVAAALMGLLALLAMEGVGLGARSWRGVQAATGGAAEVHAAQDLVRGLVAQAMPARGHAGAAASFEGGPDRLRLLAPLPRARGGAPRAVELRLAEGGGRRSLVAAWHPGRRPDPARPPEETVLVPDVAGLRIAYLGASSGGAPAPGAPVWLDRWEGQAAAPRLVRVEVAFAGGDGRRWPALLAAPAIDADGACPGTPSGAPCPAR